MKNLYNLRSVGHPGQFVITKFDRDFNVESSYLVSADECACPQSHKPTCRHRKMLPLFLDQQHVDDGWFLDYDTKLWHQPLDDEPLPTNEEFEDGIEKELSEEEIEGSEVSSPELKAKNPWPLRGSPNAPGVEEPPAVILPPAAAAPVPIPSKSTSGAPASGVWRRPIR